MGILQTNLTKREQKVADVVKKFLIDRNVITIDSDYAFLKYCVANVCSQTLKLWMENGINIANLGLDEEDLKGIFKIKSRKRID